MSSAQMADQQAEEGFKLVDGCPTFIHHYGTVTESTTVVILIVPGNPGVATYYDDYMQSLYAQSNGRIPVLCVSHAGHVTIPKGVENGDNPEKYYDLQGQIRHKVAYIKEYIPAGCKIILIGHSIGCYIILHMLDLLPSSHSILKCMFLFPTVERMAQSDQGKYATPTLRYFRWLAPLWIYPLSFLSDGLLNSALSWYFKDRDIPKCAVAATKKLICPSAVRVITNMANEEMQKVVEADHHLVEKYLKKLWFYYGASDHWCPVEYYEDMRARHPEGEFFLCKEGYAHAYVLEHSEGMANITWKYVCDKLLEEVEL